MKLSRQGSSDTELKECAISIVKTKPREVGARIIKLYKDGSRKAYPFNYDVYVGRQKTLDYINNSNMRDVEALVFEWRASDL